MQGSICLIPGILSGRKIFLKIRIARFDETGLYGVKQVVDLFLRVV